MRKQSWNNYSSWMARLSLRNRFGLGMGLMLLPLFVLAVSTFIFFEKAVSSIEQAENEKLEEVFPLVELERQLQMAKPRVDLFLRNPTNTAHLESLHQLDRSINGSINQILKAQSVSPEKYGLVKGIGVLWDQAYTASIKVPESAQTAVRSDKVPGALEQESEAQASLQVSEQVHQNLDDAIQEIYRIQTVLSNLKARDQLEQAQKLKYSVRSLIGFVSFVAMSIALLSAFLLSRSVLHSIKVLSRGLDQLGEGKLDKRIEWRNQDEFGHLATSINLMAEKLAQSQQALIDMATLDGLTGVYNRREFNRLLKIEVERSRREGLPVSIVMLDIDHFKSINDTYGHQSGDDALRWISEVLKREIRPGDIVARYGGEEFTLILPKTDVEESRAVAERIRLHMASGQVPIQHDQYIFVTASLGCATFPIAASSEEQLMSVADKALYTAKEMGRNRVCLASDPPQLHRKKLSI